MRSCDKRNQLETSFIHQYQLIDYLALKISLEGNGLRGAETLLARSLSGVVSGVEISLGRWVVSDKHGSTRFIACVGS